MSNNTHDDNGFKKLFVEIKDFVGLKFDYLKIFLIEKLTKLISKLLIAMISVVLSLAVLFFLLFALAYALAPTVGFIGSFAIIAGIFLLLLIAMLVFRKVLFINPILKLMVDLFYDETKQNTAENEDDTATV